jgi:hypothetical protein
MLSRSALLMIFGTLSLLGFGGCKTVYSDTFSYRKNSFQPPAAKQTEITPPTDIPMPLEGATPGGLVPGGLEAIPGVPAPDAGAIPGAVPGMPEAAPAPGAAPAPAAPGAPAIPGLN